MTQMGTQDLAQDLTLCVTTVASKLRRPHLESERAANRTEPDPLRFECQVMCARRQALIDTSCVP
jgi:hypothetical protein